MFFYIGPGLGVGAAALIVLILVLIIFSFGYRLWYSLVKTPKFVDLESKNKPSNASFSWRFYAPLFTAIGIITVFNPFLFGAKGTSKYTSIQGLPLWVTVLVVFLIANSLFLVLRRKRKGYVLKPTFFYIKRTLLSISLSPLNAFLLFSILAFGTVPLFYTTSFEIVSKLKGNLVIAYAFSTVAGLLLGQSILWMKNVFFETAISSMALLNVLVAPSNDMTKITAINAATSKTTVTLMRLLGCLAIVLLDVYFLGWSLPNVLLEKGFSPNWSLITISAGSVIPFLFRTKPISDYSELSQLFHRLVLDNYNLGRALLSRQIKNVGEGYSLQGKYSRVIITGLARAGTTALTKELTKSGPFFSLDYSNMPVLLAPRLWAKVYTPKKKESAERAHGDGIKVGLASVEALEEYFFKVLKNDTYITDEGLLEHNLSKEENSLYRRYQNSIARGGIYLAKNNNTVLRLKSLLQLNSDLAVFMLVRNPLQHAHSLMVQHERFCSLQKKDPFVKEYMDWLGHHEFGQGERPFIFNGKRGQKEHPKDINYWLERWVAYYSRVEAQDNLFLIRYEDFLQNPQGTLIILQTKLSIALNFSELIVFNKNDESVGGAKPELLEQAHAIYSNLSKLCLKPSLK
jgi:hypothetical protein